MRTTAFYSKIGLALVAYLLVACNMGTKRSNHRSNAQSGNAVEDDATSAGDPSDSVTKDDTQGDGSNRFPKFTGTSESLTWKRYRAFEHGLSMGLGLSADQLCKELGRSSCINEAHLAVLGGNEPYIQAQYERLQAPSALTPVAVERIVLAACEQRRILDRDLGEQAVVFKGWPTSEASVSSDKVKALGIDLYRRLLTRDPTDSELAELEKILQIVQAPDKVALSVCFAIGSQAENVFL